MDSLNIDIPGKNTTLNIKFKVSDEDKDINLKGFFNTYLKSIEIDDDILFNKNAIDRCGMCPECCTPSNFQKTCTWGRSFNKIN